MKKFRFRMESVLKVRTLHKQMAEKDVAATNAELNRNGENLERVQLAYASSFKSEYDGNAAFMNEVMSRYRLGLKQKEEDLNEQRRTLKERLANEKQVLLRRLKDEMAIEKLKEHQKQIHQRQADLEEQNELEEIDLMKRGGKA